MTKIKVKIVFVVDLSDALLGVKYILFPTENVLSKCQVR